MEMSYGSSSTPPHPLPALLDLLVDHMVAQHETEVSIRQHFRYFLTLFTTYPQCLGTEVLHSIDHT